MTLLCKIDKCLPLEVDVHKLACDYQKEQADGTCGDILSFVESYWNSLDDEYYEADNAGELQAELCDAIVDEITQMNKQSMLAQTENDKIYIIHTNYADESFATFSPESAKNYISDYWETMFEYHEDCDDDETRAIFSGRLQKYIQDALDGKNPWNPFSYGDMECEVLTLNRQRNGYTPADGNKN